MAFPVLLKAPRLLPKFRDFCSPAWAQFLGKYGSLDYSTMAEREGISAPRTSVKNPVDHTQEHLGLWYTLDPDAVKHLYGHVSFNKEFMRLCETFRETSIMVREPALTVIDYVKRSDLSMPPNKFLLYGRIGVGKTLSLAHLVHFFFEHGWILVHIPWAPRWRRICNDISPSSSVPGCYDHPADASAWLQHFKAQNIKLLNKLQLQTNETYKWSIRESTPAGSPMTALVDHGINRSRFSSDVVMALNTELKKCATDGRCKVALVVDGINSLFCPESLYKVDGVYVNPEKFTLCNAFLQFFNNDWKNGCIVGSIDERANEDARRSSHLPRYLLRQVGWEALDPFVPILVDNYDDREMNSVIDYYVDREWLPTVEGLVGEARREVAAYTSHNPLAVRKWCSSM